MLIESTIALLEEQNQSFLDTDASFSNTSVSGSMKMQGEFQRIVTDQEIIKKLISLNGSIINLLRFLNKNLHQNINITMKLMEINHLSSSIPSEMINDLHQSLLCEPQYNVWRAALNLDVDYNYKKNLIFKFALSALIIIGAIAIAIIAMTNLKLMFVTLAITALFGYVGASLSARLLPDNYSETTLALVYFSAPVLASLYTGLFISVIIPSFVIGASISLLCWFAKKHIDIQHNDQVRASIIWENLSGQYQQLLESKELPTTKNQPSTDKNYLDSNIDLPEQWSIFSKNHSALFQKAADIGHSSTSGYNYIADSAEGVPSGNNTPMGRK